MIAFRRLDKAGNEIIAVCNFVPVERKEYRIGVPYAGIYTELFSSDDTRFGGSGITNGDTIRTEDVPMHGHEQSILLDLAPNTVIFLKCRRRRPKKADAALAAEKEKTPRKAAAAVKTKKAVPSGKSRKKTAVEK